jgi:hypothetical protein
MTKYNLKDLKPLIMSRRYKIKHGWSKDMGAGFIYDDIKDIELLWDKRLIVKTEAFEQKLKVNDLNLRETEEALVWLLKNKTAFNKYLPKKLLNGLGLRLNPEGGIE